VACSSFSKGLSNARLRTLNNVSDHVPTFINVPAVPNDDIFTFAFFISSPFVFQNSRIFKPSTFLNHIEIFII
jgi:hypothetical protein